MLVANVRREFIDNETTMLLLNGYELAFDVKRNKTSMVEEIAYSIRKIELARLWKFISGHFTPKIFQILASDPTVLVYKMRQKNYYSLKEEMLRLQTILSTFEPELK